MNLLPDTHTALWAVVDSPKLSATARQIAQAQVEPLRLLTHD